MQVVYLFKCDGARVHEGPFLCFFPQKSFGVRDVLKVKPGCRHLAMGMKKTFADSGEYKVFSSHFLRV